MTANSVYNPGVTANNFRDKMMPYLNRWYLFLISLVISFIAVSIYLDFTTPQYKVTGTIQIPDDKKGDGILKSTAFSDLNMFHEEKTSDNEIEILRSRDLIYSVIKKLHLETAYFYESDFLKTNELYKDELPLVVSVNRLSKLAYLQPLQLQILSGDTFVLSDDLHRWIYNYGQEIKHNDYNFTVNKGPAFRSGPKLIGIKFKNLEQLASAYSLGGLKVDPVIKESNTINVSLNDAVPQRGIDILANLITTYNAQSIAKKNAMAINTILFIDKRLQDMGRELSLTEGDIESFKQQNGAVDAASGTQINLQKSAEYNQLLENADVQLGIVNSIESYLGNPNNKFNVVPSTMGLKDPVLNTLITRFNDLQIERNRMLNSANINNPLVQNLSDQISSLQRNIRENLANIKTGFIIERNHLRQNSAQYDSKVRAVPSLEKGLLQRGREQGVKTNLFQYLLQKREETALSLSATIPTSQLIDKPAYSPVPDFPKKPLMYLLAFIIGFSIPILIIYLKQLFSSTVKNAASLMEIKGIRVLGELSHNDFKSPIVVQSGRQSVIGELFRYIRSNVGILNPNMSPKTMLITSCIKGEGKTFFSLNMGLTLAQLNKKVLLLEFDLRKPDLLNKLGMTQKIGISDYLQDNTIDLMDLVKPYGKATNLYVLGCGSISQNPAELLLSPRVDLMFELLNANFDYLIIDTSPVGQVADAFSLARFADLSIYVVRYNYSNTQQLSILQDIYDNEKLKNLMVVFNDAKKENRHAYAYGGYGYATGYGS
ncbi:GumC family protein [Mucilaginibacter xinganensis]|uniref:Polysaccharide biosynthesis protein n=1 Tax=Mucilaginibacter xinganensis TaxID=1234841 RepID=A0A223NYF7_9SPHI|nr:tyrosine-protein kinase family protein [Mucilaginibacter xinganensis]ASU34734.1 polysaccharide biosynthesis protein [Mucilaginibacter xinganensis]